MTWHPPLAHGCIVCAGPLAPTERQTCLRCLASVRVSLDGVVWLYELLPAVAMAAGWGSPPGVGRGEVSDPGGDAIVMLAGGSGGLRHLFDLDDERPDDPPSVSFELGRWEDDWRLVRGEPAASYPMSVAGSAKYLGPRLGWASNHHLAFDEFAADLRGLWRRLAAVTSVDDRPERGAPCFDCGAFLERHWTDEGLADEWSCPRCRRVYEWAAYWLAVRAALEAARAS